MDVMKVRKCASAGWQKERNKRKEKDVKNINSASTLIFLKSFFYRCLCRLKEEEEEESEGRGPSEQRSVKLRSDENMILLKE